LASGPPHANAQLHQSAHFLTQRARLGKGIADLLVSLLQLRKSFAESNEGFGEFAGILIHGIFSLTEARFQRIYSLEWQPVRFK
jgi:hypothetical protein